MKKNVLIIFVILPFAFAFAQTEKSAKVPVVVSPDNLTAREVGYMAVFPGCERLDINNKKDLQSCLAQEINVLLGKKMDSFIDKMDKQGLTSAVAKVQFVVDKDGKIVQVKAMSGGNEELGIESVKAMNAIAEKIKKIQPATLIDGTSVNLVFQLPVKIILQDSKIEEFKWTEVVIATLSGTNQKFEVREKKNETQVKVYEIKDEKELFLGNFNSFSDVIKLEPYKSIFTFSQDKLLLAEKKINNIVYRLYHSNTNDNFLDAYKVVGDKEELLESFPKSSIEFSSLYLKLILR